MPYKKSYGKKKYNKRPYNKGYKKFRKYNKPKYDGAVAIKCFNVDPVYWLTTYGAYFITGWG